jgi:rhodanese-related sulfurtransferase
MRVPGASCLPNGELAHRFPAAVAESDTPVVVTCAGRTRGIIGVLGLRLAGIEAPVYALENGTQGWQLAGFALERGNTADPYPALDAAQAAATRVRAEALRQHHGIPKLTATEAAAWRDDAGRTTFLFDLRAPEEIAADPAPAFTPALSGQLVQATDLWVGVRHARLVLMDDLGLRAAIAAFWLRQLGFEVAVAVLDDGFRRLPACPPQVRLPAVEEISGAEALAKLNSGAASLIDLRSSASFRLGHVAGARWSIRPRLKSLDLPQGQTILLVGDDPSAVALAAGDLAAAQTGPVRVVEGGHEALVAGGAEVVASPEEPAGDEAIDFLHFVHDRHDGNLEASRQYLAWEQGLVAQLDGAERAAFRLSDWSDD